MYRTLVDVDVGHGLDSREVGCLASGFEVFDLADRGDDAGGRNLCPTAQPNIPTTRLTWPLTVDLTHFLATIAALTVRSAAGVNSEARVSP